MWFSKYQRSLPWREERSPYRVWISEVMLQQTQVSVVIPYFNRWMEAFPTIEALAKADIDDVIKLWEGLGYYSRARNLHKAAQFVCAQMEGRLPSCKASLLKIPGIGPYTAGAIAAFAFGEKVAAVDGNVRRVMARLYGIEESIDLGSVQSHIEELALQLLPDSQPEMVVEALIELGALICQKKPHCFDCPLNQECLAHKKGLENKLPIRKARAKITALHRFVYVACCAGHVLVQRQSEKRVMQDLWHFPYIELDSPEFELGSLVEKLKGRLGELKGQVERLERIKHGFTRYQAHLYPHIWEVERRVSLAGCHWVDFRQLEQLPFCSGHREIRSKLLMSSG